MYEIVLYKDARGNSPIESLIEELDRKAETSKTDRVSLRLIDSHIQMLQRVGTRAGVNYIKHIEGEVWELRPGKNRILFFAWKGNTFVLLHWFRKTTNKTPRREIEKAKSEIKNWVEIHGH